MNDSPARPFWAGLMPRLALVATAALLAWPIFGEGWAAATAIVGLLLLLVIQTWNLARLARWLRQPEGGDFPDAGGAWGQVFLELSRHLRWQAKAQRAVVAELESLKEAAWALPDGVVILDENNVVLWCNRMAGEHLGVQHDRDLGTVVAQLVRAPGFAEFLARREQGAHFLLAGRGIKPRSYALEAIRYSEQRRLLVSFDVTDLKLAEAMRSDFVANVSHELRTPLTVVSGFLEHFAGDSEMSAEERQRFVLLMTEQSQRMLRLVDDLLTLSRLEAEPAPGSSEETIDMDDAMQSLLFEAEGLSGGRHQFTMTCAPNTPLRGNRHELRSAFSNLISNAIRYTPDGGAIYIAWETRKGGAHFLVKDSGVGIPPEHLPRLTERFYRVDKGRSRDTGGTGLGLAIVKHVLLRHQAKLEISSDPGRGSTFMAVFPAWRVGGDSRRTARDSAA